jgi:hypothetical protein
MTEFLNFHDQEIMLNDLVAIWKLSVREEAEDPEPKYKERTVMVLKLTERLGLIAACIRMFEDID